MKIHRPLASLSLSLLAGALLAACGGATATGESVAAVTYATCPPEPTHLDNRRQPVNAAGQIRQCWPGEAKCVCDRDNDCYKSPGYVPCTPTDAGTVITDAATDARADVVMTADARVDAATDARVDSGVDARTDAAVVDARTDAAASADGGTCVHEATHLDDRHLPVNAAGQIRECWPGEALCSCDRDNDCYAQPGYVACTPANSPDGGTVPPADAGTPPPADSGTVGSDAAMIPPSGTVLPPFDSATEAHVRDVIAVGLAHGNRRTVFAKIGDSITESASFLMDCGHGWYDLGAYTDLLSTIQYFSSQTLPNGENSFTRPSVSAVAGWTTDDALAGGDPGSPLTRELDAIHPIMAIVMYGTNDIDRSNLSTYTANMNRIVDIMEARGTVPVLSTIPDRNDSTAKDNLAVQFNSAIRGIAQTRHLPLIDYWQAMHPLPSHGVSSDNIHPNIYNQSDGCVFTTPALQFGYNQRNLTAIQMFARMRGY